MRAGDTRSGQPTGGASFAPERRLATILVADVFEYSVLMGKDEERTVQTLRGHRAVFEELLRARNGRVFNTAGDATLAEFESPLAAVLCAIELQAALRKRNEALRDTLEVWFRIGINLGDVIVHGTDLLGDGVNIAARIQGIAEPGGICISGSVYDQIREHPGLRFERLGEKTFKNIAQPVRTFAIIDEAARAPARVRWRAARKGRIAAGATAIACVAAITAIGYGLYRDQASPVAKEDPSSEGSQRVPVAKPDAAQEQTAKDEAEKEARILAELRAARDTLARAEGDKAAAQETRLEKDTAQRESKLQAELRATNDALRKAATATAKKREDAPAAASGATGSVESSVEQAVAPPAIPNGPERFDGIYAGRMCMIHVDNSERCAEVTLTARRGTLSATWPSPWNTNPARARGTITAEGAVELALSGFNARTGQPMPGKVRGRWEDGTIKTAGAWTWSGPSPISAQWVRSGDGGATDAGTGASADANLQSMDGAYSGRMCNVESGGKERCWNAELAIRQGSLSAAWPGESGSDLARATGSLAADGSIQMALSGFRPGEGSPLGGTMLGSWAGGKLTVAGAWANGVAVNGTWISSSLTENPAPRQKEDSAQRHKRRRLGLK